MTVDAQAPVDAPIDADVSCRLRRAAAGTPGNLIGDTATTATVGNLDCGPDALPIGASVLLSNQNTWGQDGGGGGLRPPGAYQFSLVCGAVTLHGDGTGTVGTPTTTIRRIGAGNFGWTPASSSSLATCPPGWILGGLSVHGAEPPGGMPYFNNVAITCYQIGVDGIPTGQQQVVPIVGSGTVTADPASGECAASGIANAAAVGVGVYATAGIDAVALSCAPLVCQ
ncbi:MAG: hypothetical protein R3B06_14795 [Kofleriaceae bacterium]